MTIRTLVSSLIVLCSVVYASAVQANTYYINTVHGTACVPTRASAGDVDYNSYGVFNTSTTNTVTVTCPVQLSVVGRLLESVYVYGWDRNTSTSIVCYAYISAEDGTPNVTSYPISISYTGGTSSNGSYVLSPAFNLATYGTPTMTVACAIPPSPSLSSVNVVSSIEVDTYTNP